MNTIGPNLVQTSRVHKAISISLDCDMIFYSVSIILVRISIISFAVCAWILACTICEISSSTTMRDASFADGSPDTPLSLRCASLQICVSIAFVVGARRRNLACSMLHENVEGLISSIGSQTHSYIFDWTIFATRN